MSADSSGEAPLLFLSSPLRILVLVLLLLLRTSIAEMFYEVPWMAWDF